MSATLQAVDRDFWRRTARTFRDYNYRQLWEFGVACAQRVGASSEHVAVVDGSEVLALADVRVRLMPLGRCGIAYINGGPLVRREDGSDEERLRKALEALRSEYVDRRGLLLRVAQPPGPGDQSASQAALFSACGYVLGAGLPSYRTMLLKLSRPLQDIREHLRQKWRNCLNAAERNGLALRSGTDTDTFAAFCNLYDDLARKGFAVELDARFYAEVQPQLVEDERFEVTLAEHEGRPVAGHVASVLGDTCVYLLGAANEAGLRQKASYLLQWDVLTRARQRGCRWYDLGGIDPVGNPGVYAFKAGLGGIEVTAPGPFECRPTRLTAAVVSAAERAYRGLRALHRRVSWRK